MAQGWWISLTDNGRMRIFFAGIADQVAAEKAVRARCSAASGVVLLPLKDGEFEKFGLVEGEVIESTE